MKKINKYSAQFKIIQKPMSTNENQFDKRKIIQKKYRNKTKNS